MKWYSFVGVSCLSLFGFVFCSPPTQSMSLTPETKREFVKNLEKETVALVRIREEDGQEFPYCGGVWIAKDKILTAKHCTKNRIVFGYRVMGSSELRDAVILDTDDANDLALLLTNPTTTPDHPVATLAKEVWDGEHVNIVGHTVGLWWTFMEGIVSSARSMKPEGDDEPESSIQVSSPAWFGNSGGGGFNDAGELLGISSWVFTKAPMMTFFIHRRVIKNFLKKNNL